MEKSRKSGLALSLLVMALGFAWLLNEIGVVPGKNWIWIVALGVSGILLLAFAPLDRFVFIVGTTLIVSSVLAGLRQMGKLPVHIEVPVLIIIVGLLSFFSQLLPLGKITSSDSATSIDSAISSGRGRDIPLDPPLGSSSDPKQPPYGL